MPSPTFSPIDLSDYAAYLPFWQATPRRSADYTFTNLWGWSACYGLEWRVDRELCWIRQTRRPDGTSTEDFWAPVGDWEAADWEHLPLSGRTLHRVPDQLCDLLQRRLPGRVEIEESRGQWEYLYTQKALSTLSGNRLHKKKNHVNGYIRAYGEEYRPLGPEDVPAVLRMQEEWFTVHNDGHSPSLTAENEVIKQVMQRWDALPELRGGALYVENQMVAFSVGEPLDDTTMVVHFEKALHQYRGVYQAMNFFFAKYAARDFEWLNREQDTDEEGLRQAKTSYYPADFLRKNRVRFL